MVQENFNSEIAKCDCGCETTVEELCGCGCGGSLDVNSDNPCLCEDCTHEPKAEDICDCGCGGSLDANNDNACTCDDECC